MAQVKEKLMPYGPLKAFNLVMDKQTGNSKVCSPPALLPFCPTALPIPSTCSALFGPSSLPSFLPLCLALLPLLSLPFHGALLLCPSTSPFHFAPPSLSASFACQLACCPPPACASLMLILSPGQTPASLLPACMLLRALLRQQLVVYAFYFHSTTMLAFMKLLAQSALTMRGCKGAGGVAHAPPWAPLPPMLAYGDSAGLRLLRVPVS